MSGESSKSSSDEDNKVVIRNNIVNSLSSKILARRIAKKSLEYRFYNKETGLIDWTTRGNLFKKCPKELKEAELNYFNRKRRLIHNKKLKELLKGYEKTEKSKPIKLSENDSFQRKRQSATDLQIGKLKELVTKERYLSRAKYMFSLQNDLRFGIKFDQISEFQIKMNRTGLVLDVNCEFHFGNPDEPENPERYETCLTELTRLGLKNQCFPVMGNTHHEEVLKLIKLVHSEKHSKNLFELNRQIGNEITDSNEGESYYEGRFTAKAVAHSVAHSTALTELVFDGKLNNGFCLIRPPGHHCDYDRKFGFCHVNNIAIAAKRIIQKSPSAKVLIFDWDLHHGNGTEDIFYEESRVLYISVHQEYDDRGKPMFPGTGSLSDVGGRSTRGRNVNIPIPIGCGDREFRSILDLVITPIAREFAADIVLVSAGFDSCAGDPLGLLELTPEMFSYMTRRLSDEQKDGRLALFLEGGYNPEMVAKCVACCVEALLGHKSDYVPQPSTEKDFLACLDNVIRAQRNYWKSLYSSVAPREEPNGSKSAPNTLQTPINLTDDTVRLSAPNGLPKLRTAPKRNQTRTKRLVALARYCKAHPELETPSSPDTDSASSFVVDGNSSEDYADYLRQKRRRHKNQLRMKRRRTTKQSTRPKSVKPRKSDLKLVTKTANADEVIDLTGSESTEMCSARLRDQERKREAYRILQRAASEWDEKEALFLRKARSGEAFRNFKFPDDGVEVTAVTANSSESHRKTPSEQSEGHSQDSPQKNEPREGFQFVVEKVDGRDRIVIE